MTEIGSLEHKIDLLGDAFRGLWKGYELTHINDEEPKEYWCLTFTYKGRMVETPYMNFSGSCFDFALKKLDIKDDNAQNNNHNRIGKHLQPGL